LLSEQLQRKDSDIHKLKSQALGGDGEDKIKNELRRAYNILKQLKKRLNKNQRFNQNISAYDVEYNSIIQQLEETLGIDYKSHTAINKFINQNNSFGQFGASNNDTEVQFNN
jgi:mannosyltransferase OCH1-like enzyme